MANSVSYKVAFLRGVVVGVLVPLFLYANYHFADRLFGEEELWLWPSSLLLMGYDLAAPSEIALVMTLSIVINAVLYGLIAMAGLAALRIVTRAL